jgi:uncharacterized protein (TIGR02453 family)
MTDRYFTRKTFDFLSELAANNRREWFDEHRQDYEDLVRTPALEFIGDMEKEMPAISRHFRASPKKAGGSLMRIQRNLRFSRDKTPYKTNIGMHFRHEVGKDIHAPGYYVHIEPGECFVGVGLWHPDPDTLAMIRKAIAEHGDKWITARDDKGFSRHYTLEGDALANVPRGYAKDHPLVEDLKRKDFIGLAGLSQANVTSANFREQVVERFRQAAPFMRFLCNALELRF